MLVGSKFINSNEVFVGARANIGRVLTAAGVADLNQGSYIEMPQFQPEILDVLNRNVTILNRIAPTPATGHPHRYMEQTKLAHNAVFVDPRNLGVTVVDEDRGRVEKSAFIKALQSRITFSLFDTEVVRQQGVFEQLLAKDMSDMIVDVLRTQNKAIWQGTDTSLSAPTKVDYMGLLKQITQTGTVGNGATDYITDTIRSQIAILCANTEVSVFPGAVYMNPLTLDVLEREELKRGTNMKTYALELAPGIIINRIPTQNGFLPIITDPFLPVVNNGDNTAKIHSIVLLNEGLIERPYITSPTPRIFKMGLTPSLVDDYVAVQFDTVVAKSPDHAHIVLTKTIPNA